MSADELGGGVYDDVGSVFDGSNQEGRAEGVVHNHDGTMAVSYLGDAVDIGHIGVGVAEGFDDHGLGVRTESSLNGFKVGGVDDGGFNALRAQRVLQQVVGTAIKVVGSYHMVAVAGHVLKRISNSGCARGHGQAGYTAFKGGHAVFKDTLGRIGQTTVDVACVTQTEAIGSVLRVTEYIGCGLVDRHGASVGGYVRLFLTNMELQSLKAIIFCSHNL